MNINFVNGTHAQNGEAIQWSGANGQLIGNNFTNNTADYGGAVYWWARNPTITNNNFNKNTASGNGGAIWVTDNDNGGTITKNNFTENRARNGGAIQLSVIYANVEENTFTQNHADEEGGAVYWNGENGKVYNSNFIENDAKSGGAIYWRIENGKVEKSNFTGNKAEKDGGAVYWNGYDGKLENSNLTGNTATERGGAIYWAGDDSQLVSSTFTNNNASYGGAIYWSKDNGLISQSNFTDNTAINKGGAILWIGNGGQISQSNFIGNTANEGGAIQWTGNDGTINNSNLTDNTATEDGGAIQWDGFDGQINYSTFENNTTERGIGGAIRWDVGAVNGQINNSNFTSNTAEIDFGGANYSQAMNFMISNSNFNNNTAKSDGGAIFLWGDNSSVGNSNFTDNTTEDKSGGAAVFNGDNITVSNSNFNNNRALFGGAIRWWGENGTLNNSNFTNNTANEGGAICWIGENGKVEYSNFNNNNASKTGGAIYWNETAINGAVNNSNFTENTATDGGAMELLGDNGIVSNSKFIANTAKNLGGAIHLDSEGSKINNNIFLNNINTISSQVSSNNIDCNWWGNNASNYADKPNEYCDNWLFLNATADPNPMELISTSEISFKLYLYNETAEEKITEYDHTLLPAINLTLSSTKGTIDKENIGLDEIITYTPNALGSGSVTAMIENVEQTIELEIIRQNPDLSFEDQETTYNKSATINIQYKEEATGKVNVKLEGEQFNYTLRDLELNTVLSLGDINSDTYTVTVEYLGDENYIEANATGTLTVKKIQTEIIPTKDTININIGDTSNIGYSLDPEDAVGDIVFTSSNESVATVDSTGAMNAMAIGTATITLALSSINYEAPNATVTVTVSKKDTKITAASVTTTYNVAKNLVKTLKDNKGKPISGVQVTVNLGSNKKYTTDKNGQVKVAIGKLVPKTYTAKISFAGNSVYEASSATAKVVVKKATPKITAKAKTFKFEDKTKKYTITLKDNKNKVMKNKKVTLKVNGKTYTAKTNSKGVATFKLTKLTKKGKFTAAITYAGDKYYKKLNKKVKIIVKAPAWKTVARGSKDKTTVKKIQRALKNNGYYLSYKGRYLKVDGVFGVHTERGVKQFQKSRKLKVTGKVDYTTAKKLKVTK